MNEKFVHSSDATMWYQMIRVSGYALQQMWSNTAFLIKMLLARIPWGNTAGNCNYETLYKKHQTLILP